ncbi:MAG TPA: DUF4097 family beta strand repeat-containing protein [Terriglobales bacterium]|nr:DUF4097 family beta strand repeat-containing protein [Terriglobales bacterium]
MFKKMPVFLLMLLASVSTLAGAEEWRKTFSVTEKPELRVNANDADIHVYASDRKDIEAVVTTHNDKIGPNAVRINDHQSGNRIDIDIHVPQFHILNFRSHTVKIELAIPKQADVDLHSGDGAITAEALNGNISLTSGDGNIRVDNANGSLTLESGDGRIECRGVNGRLRAETKDGAMRIDGVFSDLDLHTGDGRIDAQVQSGSKMGSTWSVRSGDGSITLALPDGFSADLDAHTGDGHISVDFPVTVQGGALRQNEIRGKLNNGGPTLEMRSGDGNITVRRG